MSVLLSGFTVLRCLRLGQWNGGVSEFPHKRTHISGADALGSDNTARGKVRTVAAQIARVRKYRIIAAAFFNTQIGKVLFHTSLQRGGPGVAAGRAPSHRRHHRTVLVNIPVPGAPPAQIRVKIPAIGGRAQVGKPHLGCNVSRHNRLVRQPVMDVPCQHQLYGSVKRNPPVGDLGFFFPAWDALPFWDTAQTPSQVDAAASSAPPGWCSNR